MENKLTPFVVTFKPAGAQGQKVMTWTRFYSDALTAFTDIRAVVTGEFPEAVIVSIVAGDEISLPPGTSFAALRRQAHLRKRS